MIKEENGEGKEIILHGLYPYKLKMKNPETSKSFLRYLFNKYTEINVTQKRFDEENTLIMINLSINKIGLASLVHIIDKYDIFYKNEIPQIIW